MTKYQRKPIEVEADQFKGLDYHSTVETAAGAHELMSGEWVVTIPGEDLVAVLTSEQFKAQYAAKKGKPDPIKK